MFYQYKTRCLLIYLATFVTLYVVPVIYTLLRTKPPSKHELEERFDAELREGKGVAERHA